MVKIRKGRRHINAFAGLGNRKKVLYIFTCNLVFWTILIPIVARIFCGKDCFPKMWFQMHPTIRFKLHPYERFHEWTNLSLKISCMKISSSCITIWNFHAWKWKFCPCDDFLALAMFSGNGAVHNISFMEFSPSKLFGQNVRCHAWKFHYHAWKFHLHAW